MKTLEMINLTTTKGDGMDPQMHCQAEFERDIKGRTYIDDKVMLRWFNDRYSTSKHILTLYSIARGLTAKRILEIGFGRSSFVLARAAIENEGKFYSCDHRNFSYLFTEKEKSVTEFISETSDKVWSKKEIIREGIDFAFLDYFSRTNIGQKYCITEIMKCFRFLKQNGVIAIHDVTDDRFSVGKTINKLRLVPGLEVVKLGYCYGLALIRKSGKSKYGEIKDMFVKKTEK